MEVNASRDACWGACDALRSTVSSVAIVNALVVIYEIEKVSVNRLEGLANDLVCYDSICCL